MNKASTIYNKVFVKEKNTCRTDIQNEYFTQLVKKHFYAPVPIECGSEKDVETDPPFLNNNKTRAMCSSCQLLLSIPAEKGGIKRMPYGKKNASFVTAPASAAPTAASASASIPPTAASDETLEAVDNIVFF